MESYSILSHTPNLINIVSYTPELMHLLYYYNNHINPHEFMVTLTELNNARENNDDLIENLAFFWKSLKLCNTVTGLEVLRRNHYLRMAIQSKYVEAITSFPQCHYIFLEFYHLFLTQSS
jgi:hypothetical protein